MPKLLELLGVSKSFGGLHVVDNLDLHVDEGEIVSVIGPNGAGKTTLFNLITGVYRPDAGDIRLEGRSLLGLAPHARILVVVGVDDHQHRTVARRHHRGPQGRTVHPAPRRSTCPGRVTMPRELSTVSTTSSASA